MFYNKGFKVNNLPKLCEGKSGLFCEKLLKKVDCFVLISHNDKYFTSFIFLKMLKNKKNLLKIKSLAGFKIIKNLLYPNETRVNERTSNPFDATYFATFIFSSLIKS